MRPSRLKATVSLVETPTQLKERVESLALLAAATQREVATAQQQLSATHAAIQTARVQWEKQQAREALELRLKQQSFEDSLTPRMDRASSVEREVQESLQRQQASERDLRTRLLDVAEREQKVADLNQERLEIGLLRRETAARRMEVEARWSEAQTVLNDGKAAMDKAAKILADCEARNQAMNVEWNKLTAWSEELTLKTKDLAIVQQAVDAKLDALNQETLHASAG